VSGPNHSQQGFICNPDKSYSVFSIPGASETQAFGINNAGQVSGRYIDNRSSTHGFLYASASGGGVTVLNVNNSLNSTTTLTYANGLNNSGDVVGFYKATVTLKDGSTAVAEHGFVYSDGNYQSLDYLPAVYDVTTGSSTTLPTAINDKGQIVGWYLDSGRQQHGFLYDPNSGWTAIDYPGVIGTQALGINNNGQIVGHITCSQSNPCANGLVYAGFVANPVAASVVDPIPLSGKTGSLLAQDVPASDTCPAQSSPPITTCPSVLASQGRVVQGVAADGVAQVVIRIAANSVNEPFTITLFNDQGVQSTDVDADGGLAQVGTDPLSSGVSSSITVTAQETNGGSGPSQPMAFAIYRAPVDFVRASSAGDKSLSNRTVRIKFQANDITTYDSTKNITVVRSPVMLIHGLWSNAEDAWKYLQKPLGWPTPKIDGDHPFWVMALDYSKAEPDGVNASLTSVHRQILGDVAVFREKQNVAAVQVDVIAHSLGGLVARALTLKAADATTPAYIRSENFSRGDIHKALTLDTPYLGSPLADKLVNSNNACYADLYLGKHPVDKSVEDLQQMPLSSLLKSLQVNAAHVHLRVNALVGVASTSQESSTAQDFNDASFPDKAWFLKSDCAGLLPQGGFQKIFGGDSDLVVSTASQSAHGLGVNGAAIPTTILPPQGYVHAVNPVLFPVGPDVLGATVTNGMVVGAPAAQTAITNQLVVLLNTPLNSSSFGDVLP
jgi:probable HAF family extracellular repeat protein